MPDAATPAGPLLHTARIPVRWGDMDALGHVNNVAFIRYAEQARVEVLDAMGPDWAAGEALGPLVVALGATYKRPVVYPATVLAAVRATRVGRTSLTIDTVMTLDGEADGQPDGQADGEPVCSVEATLVWVDRQTGRPTPLPDAVRVVAVRAVASPETPPR